MFEEKEFEYCSNITSNSQQVVKNSIFVAIKGMNYDGHNYIEEAIKKGASVLIVDKSFNTSIYSKHDVKFIKSDDTAHELSRVSSIIYKQPENIVSVTGTDGKTSVAYFYKQIIELLGNKSASIGTLGVISSDNLVSYEPTLTTPRTEEMHKILHQLKMSNIDNVILEASSHGLQQKRLDHVLIKAAAFTSFSQDHLDYHISMQSYLDAKLKLYEHVMPENSIAIINSDMKITNQVINRCRKRNHKILTYGKNGDFLKVDKIEYKNNQSNFQFTVNGKLYKQSLCFIGDFQIYNILCAVTIAVSMGYELEKCISVLKYIKPVPGRMEQINNTNIFVDFAHTPESLKKSLQVLKDNKEHDAQLIVVFGCGGDRDKGKRSKMGKVASDIADIIIVTDDNPRTENPSEIRKEILKSCSNAIEEGNRENAIKKAINYAKKKDIVLIAGKGHETTQTIGNKTFHFSDSEIIKKYTQID